VIIAPDGQIRGPGTTPASIACFRPKLGPPTSRTAVKPRIRVAVASAPAWMLLKPMSPKISCCGVARMSIVCQWASIRPGISVLPCPSMTWAPAGDSALAPMRAIRLPLTSTEVGGERLDDLPSNTRTFRNRTSPAKAIVGRAHARTTHAATSAPRMLDIGL
jgi:hypothetical protein